jgi:phosphotriesterase-related protein
MEFQKSGGKSILELSVPGIRTKVPAIKKLAEKTGAHIILSTGLYTGDSWPDKYLSMGEKDIYNYMMGEVFNGVEDTGIKPGHLKIAVQSLTRKEESALRAAAKVANETGLSLTVHCDDGRQVVKVIESEGMDVSRAVIAHVAGAFGIRDMRLLVSHPELFSLRLDYVKELLDTGVNISLEFSPGNVESEDQNRTVVPDWLRLAGVIKLLDLGYADQIVFGTDTCAKVMTRSYGGEGYSRLTRFAVPKLREFGVSDYHIRTITEKNPARILAF